MIEKLNKLYYKLKSKSSFSQCGEDLIINHIFKLKGIKNPTYVDIGAFDPLKLSNTFLFYLYGSRGINIEPNPDQFELFVKTRKRDINLNIGISDFDGALDYFYFEDPSLNSFSKKEKDNYCLYFDKTNSKKYQFIKSEKIQVKKLGDVLKENYFINFDLLSIDTEGLDFNILKSLDFSITRPKVICFESFDHSMNGFGEKRFQILDFLISLGYSEYAFTGLNSIMIDSNFFKNV